MRTLRRGNNDSGFILLDAIVALFIVTITVGSIFTAVATTIKYTERSTYALKTIIDSRNTYTEELFTNK